MEFKDLEKYYSDNVFYEKYVNDFLNRLTTLNISSSFDMFFKNTKDNLEIYNIIDLADHINKSETVYGMQNINEKNERYLYQKTYKLTKAYNELWGNSDVLIKEIFLYKRLIDISPFLINNKLIFNIIISANLINNNYPPFIMDDELIEFIENESDYFIIKEMLVKRLENEYKNIKSMYNETYKIKEET